MEQPSLATGDSEENSFPLLAVATGLSCAALLLYIFVNFSEGAKYGLFLKYLQLEFFNSIAQIHASRLLGAAGFAAAALYFCSLFLAGREISFLAQLRIGNRLSMFVIDTALGAGLFSLLLLGLGLSGLLHRSVIAGLYAAPFMTAAARAALNKRSRRPGAVTQPYDRLSGFSVAAISLFVLFSAIGFIFCLSPSTATDALNYHLAIPDLYMDSGRIFYIPFMVAGNWPQGMEMHFMAGMALHGGTLARLAGFGFVVMSALGAAALARRASGVEGAVAAAVLFISVPITCSQFYLDNVEPAMAFFEIAALILFLEWRRRGGLKLLLFSGLMCGFAMAVKLTGVTFFAIAFILAAHNIFSREGERKHGARNLLLFCCVALAPALPWLLKSFLWTGNPVWPFLYSVLGGRNWSALNARDHSFFLDNAQGARGIRMFILSLPGLAHHAWHENIGAPLVALLPFMLLLKKPKGEVFTRLLFVSAALLFALWYVTTPQVRFLLPAIAIVCAAYAPALDIRRSPARAVFIAAVAFQLFVFTAAGLQSVPCALGGMSADEYSAAADGSVSVYRYMDVALPGDAKILFMGHTKGYYCPREYVYGDPLGQGYIRYWEYGGAEEIMSRLRNEKITHAMVSRSGTFRQADFDRKLRAHLALSPGDDTVLASALEFQEEMIRTGRWQLLFTSPDNDYSLYRIDYQDD